MDEFKSYFGSISIGSDQDLVQVSKELNAVVDGFLLREEDTGRFEDYPAFIDKKGSVEINLVGCPSDSENCEHYSFTVTCISINPAQLGKEIGSQFINSIPTNLPIEKNGYVNISEYVNKYVMTKTALKCRAAWVTQ